tara:strand:+ start:10534 stop:10719 length:186 start_codon:yes stop_codon:yes gene_type:complete
MSKMSQHFLEQQELGNIPNQTEDYYEYFNRKKHTHPKKNNSARYAARKDKEERVISGADVK